MFEDGEFERKLDRDMRFTRIVSTVGAVIALLLSLAVLGGLIIGIIYLWGLL